ncbi:MAG: glycosyltransferase [Pyrinomonadaceae bacterium]
MNLVSRAKEKLKGALSPALKLSLRRLVVGSVGVAVRLAARAYNFAGRVLTSADAQGLNVREAWDVRARPRREAPSVPAWGARDFLFLLSARREALESARAGQPVRASIIIPVFNKVEFTFQCLRSLLREIDFDRDEVIVVDNASTDETAEVLAHFGGRMRVVHNEENPGFVEACNQGAARARGRYLVFLNNDTVVLPGWLEHLIGTTEGDASVGAVGSLFLYPDGTVQEAGAIVWQRGEAFHYGRGKSAEDRRLNFAREVDYCSGASLLIRRELFERLGGFDCRSAPASYEDVDLCMGVRSLGFKVIYQPMSRLVRGSGTTTGTSVGVGDARDQTINREKFYEKWREVLERDHLPHDPALVERASNRKRGPSILVFDDRIPTPDRDAGSARMVLILKSLARVGRPVFVPLGKRVQSEYERQLWKEGVETSSAVECFRLLKERKFAAAILSRPEVAEAVLPALKRRGRDLKIVFDMVDAYFVRFEREHRLNGDAQTAAAARHYRKLEARLARASDLVWCASSEDKRAMEREATSVRIAVIPTIHPARGRGRPFAAREHLLFLGNFAHRPNADALLFFVREIFPLVLASLPEVKLYAVGDNAPAEVSDCDSERVRVLGYVPDIEPLFESCRMMVAPLRFGAGVKGKIGESLAYGLPVVTTAIGAESMGLEHGAEALITDDPRDFAAAVARLYRDGELWQRLADNGRRHIEQHFSPQAVGKVIHDSLREIGVPLDVTKI